MDFTNFADLEKHIEIEINKSLKKDVAPKVKRVMQDSIQHTVYDAYPHPTIYERRGYNDGLIDEHNIIDDVSNGTLTVENLAQTNTKYGGGSKPLSPIIVSGKGYKYHSRYGQAGYEQPRDFYKDTVDNLENSNAHVETLKKGLRQAGLDVK